MSLSYTQLYFPSNIPEISFKHFSFYSLGLNFLRGQRRLNSLSVANPHQYPPNALLPSQRVSPTVHSTLQADILLQAAPPPSLSMTLLSVTAQGSCTSPVLPATLTQALMILSPLL